MTTLTIKDITADQALGHETMTEISGGFFWGPHISILSPHLVSLIAPIEGAAAVPTEQTNNLVQADITGGGNAVGAQGVSNNKFAYQGNSNQVGYFLSPSVGHHFLA